MEQPEDDSDFQHVVVLGDSVSDIGRMHRRPISKLPTVVINKAGRFSDGKNWVDFFWSELCGGELLDDLDTQKTLNLSKQYKKVRDNWSGGTKLAVYAEGGALGWSQLDGAPKHAVAQAAFLSTLEHQVDEYLADRSGKAIAGNTLCIIWIGANDIVTIRREPEYMYKVAINIVGQATRILNSATHVIIVDVPDPQYMPRFANKAQDRQIFARSTEIFTHSLDCLIQRHNASHRKRLHLFKISELATPKLIGQALGVAPLAQPSGSLPGAKIGSSRAETVSLLAATDVGVTEDSEFSTTRDKLHPTETVYRYLAEQILAFVRQRFTFTGYHYLD